MKNKRRGREKVIFNVWLGNMLGSQKGTKIVRNAVTFG